MKYKIIKEAIFLSRPNRFIANVIVDGEQQAVHVKNTGRCKELLREGTKIFLEDHEIKSPIGEAIAGSKARKARKTRYSLIAVEKKIDNSRDGNSRNDGRSNDDRSCSSGCHPDAGIRLINIDSFAPNRVVGEALAVGGLVLPGMEFPLTLIRPEMTFGTSRFDFYIEDKRGKKGFIEVKGVTLEQDGIARFPDAPTERGVKHVKELSDVLKEGMEAFVIFVIQMKRIARFEPNDETHQAFGDALREARENGVVILAYDCKVAADQLVLDCPVPIKL